MEIVFLGTSAGTPTKTRNVTGLALRIAGARHWSLIDCGEGTQHRILHTNLSLMSLQAIFVTHLHGDHCYGLPGLLASAGMLGRSEKMVIVAPPTVHRFVQAALETTELRLPYPIEFVDVANAATTVLLPDFDVQATALSHRVPSFAYSFTEKSIERKLDLAKLDRDGIARGAGWGQLQQGKDIQTPDGRTVRALDYLVAPRRRRKIIVGGDNDTPALLTATAQGADVLVHEATYTEEVIARIGPGPQHSSARRVAEFAEAAKIRNLVLTHFSPRYQEQKGALPLSDIEAEARAAYAGTLFLANDLERYVLDKQGVMSKAG